MIILLNIRQNLINAQISRASAAVSSTIASTTEPIRNTAAYKTLSETLVDALDDSGSAKHAGFEEKEARRKRRQLRLAKAGKDGGLTPGAKRTEANPEYVDPHSFLKGSLSLIAEPVQMWSCTRILPDKKNGTG